MARADLLNLLHRADAHGANGGLTRRPRRRLVRAAGDGLAPHTRRQVLGGQPIVEEYADDDRDGQAHSGREHAVHAPDEPGDFRGVYGPPLQRTGRFGLMEMVAPKCPGPSRHLHHRDDKGYYVLAGNMTFYVGEGTYEGGRGCSCSCRTAVMHRGRRRL